MLFRANPLVPDLATEVRNATHRAQQLAESIRQGVPHTLASQPFLQLEVLLLDLQLGNLAQAVHDEAKKYPGAEELTGPLVLCTAQVASLLGDVERAVTVLASAAKSAGALCFANEAITFRSSHPT
jgi:hypothetical protein